MNSRFLGPAEEEFNAAIDFYEEQASGLGASFVAEVEHALETLLSTPQIGAPFDGDTRRILLRRFPFDVVYVVEPTEIIVVAIAHQRRKPGYWTDR
jgi:plasmid stabilization system protein ParE